MTDINVNQVLAQMRAMSAEAKGKTEKIEGQEDFSSVLKQSIDAVNDTQKTAGKLAKEFEIGESDVSLAEVMIASQKASVSFQAMVQVRNKLVEAYKDVMNMPM